MMVAIHALLGAAVGQLIDDRVSGFAGGVISHALADLVPHKDYSLTTEAMLGLPTLTLIGITKGWKSPAFWSAVGGIVPDIENGFEKLLNPRWPKLFPTHNGLHGEKVKELCSQVGVALLCVSLLSASCSRVPAS